ncbi:hypothetical protein PG988_003643 [Apiospora saccharicola]
MTEAGNKDTFISFVGVGGSVPLQYNVHWKGGCELASGATAVYAANPLSRDIPSNYECVTILTDSWRDCNNGEVGRSINAGCLV